MVFEKYEGLRNDFLIIDERPLGEGRDRERGPSLPLEVRTALCDRNAGVGADGVLTILPPRDPRAVARMHITNSDGSVPEMCGNGVRCVSRWLHDRGDVALLEEHLIDTDGGLMRCVVVEGGVSVDLPGPDFTARSLGGELRQQQVEAGGARYVATAVSMGNPHLVLHAHEPPSHDLVRRLGPLFERLPRFPDRANVGFAHVAGELSLDLVVWERGAGLTQACGTGACAAVAAFVDAGVFPPGAPVRVTLPGGPLTIRLAEDGAGVTMTGPARRVFEGRARVAELVDPGR